MSCQKYFDTLKLSKHFVTFWLSDVQILWLLKQFSQPMKGSEWPTCVALSGSCSSQYEPLFSCYKYCHLLTKTKNKVKVSMCLTCDWLLFLLPDLWCHFQMGTGLKRAASWEKWRDTDCSINIQEQVGFPICCCCGHNHLSEEKTILK